MIWIRFSVQNIKYLYSIRVIFEYESIKKFPLKFKIVMLDYHLKPKNDTVFLDKNKIIKVTKK